MARFRTLTRPRDEDTHRGILQHPPPLPILTCTQSRLPRIPNTITFTRGGYTRHYPPLPGRAVSLEHNYLQSAPQPTQTRLPSPSWFNMVSALQASSSEVLTCVACYDRRPDVVLLPCGHQILCASCAHQLKEQSDECPMDRTQITMIIPRSHFDMPQEARQNVDSQKKE